MSGLKVGDKVKVQVEGRDSLGRLMVSRRPLLPLNESNLAEQQQATASSQQKSADSENIVNTQVRVLLKLLYLPKVITKLSLDYEI